MNGKEENVLPIKPSFDHHTIHYKAITNLKELKIGSVRFKREHGHGSKPCYVKVHLFLGRLVEVG